MRTKHSQSILLVSIICAVVIFSTACVFPQVGTSTAKDGSDIQSSSVAIVQAQITSPVKNDLFTYEIPWPPVRLGPYIQSIGQDSVVIAWQTEGESVGEVK